LEDAILQPLRAVAAHFYRFARMPDLSPELFIFRAFPYLLKITSPNIAHLVPGIFIETARNYFTIPGDDR
jgi:hypothetical protein